MRINGIVENIIYRNESNGYTVLQVVARKTVFTLIGNITKVNLGEEIDAEIIENSSAKYGEQYKIIDYKMTIPDKNLDAIFKFIKSLKIKGIGDATINKIIEKYGSDTINVIKNNAEDLFSIKGMTFEKLNSLRDAILNRQNEINIIIELEKFNLSPKNIEMIIEKYGSDAVNIINENPYTLSLEIEGIGFVVCDKIAKQIGIDENSIKRIESCILYVLDLEYNNGNVFVEKNFLMNELKRLLAIDIDEKINDLLYNLEINMKVKREFYNNSEIVFRRSSYNTEMKLSQLLYQKRNDITIITGGPGTGKTYNINKYLDEAKKSGLSVAICAPTGRAAKRINEVTGFNAKTIHRLLECVPDKDAKHQKIYFNINEDNKLYVDLLIVDEMSMVDELLMYALIRAIPDGTRMLLVGDVDQLPSVGAGQVLKDMIESEYFNVLKLTEIYRQGKESNIVINAHKINKGEDIDLKVKYEDFIFTHKSTDEGVRDAIKTLISKNIPNHFNIGLDQIQVICPSKIGECGTVALNKILQKELNKEDIFKNEIESFGKTLRLHDKVMQTVNNYDIPYDVVDEKENIIDTGIGIYNGDIGEIIEIDEENSTIVIKFDDRIAYYNKDDLKDITHAYAITVHKSQGSEYDVVVMPMTKTPIPLLTRKILYTAMTRAKKCIVFVGQEYYFKEMVKNLIEVKRNTALLSKLFIYDI